MKKTITSLAFAALSLAACKKNNTETPAPRDVDVQFFMNKTTGLLDSLKLEIAGGDKMNGTYVPSSKTPYKLFLYDSKNKFLNIAQSADDGRSAFPILGRYVNATGSNVDVNEKLNLK